MEQSDRSPVSLQLLAKRRLKDKLGDEHLSDSTLWRMVQRGELPRPIRISKGRIAWIESEVDQRLAERAAARVTQ